jgi:PKD repeat protein
MAIPSRRGRSVPHRQRRSPRSAEGLWGQLSDLFGARDDAWQATALTLAPRRLEPRRMLDAGAAALALDLLDAHDFVQAGPDFAQIGASQADAHADAHEQPQASVANEPPSQLQIAPLGAIDEGGTATLSLSFDDPDVGDMHSVVINWGDGSPHETLNVAPGARTFTATHQYADDNPTATPADGYTVKVRLRDDSLGETGNEAVVTIKNVAPSVTLPPPLPISENGVGVQLVAFNDPGLLDTHTVEVNWGDGSATELHAVTPGQTFFTAIHQYKDDNPTGTPADNYTISVRVFDDDGGVSAVTHSSIKVSNLAPANVQISPLAPINENDVATLDLTFDDPGTLDSHQVEINWGDGSAAQLVNVAAGARTFSTTHKYLDDNPTATAADVYTISVRVLDDDGGASTAATTNVTVNNVAPSVSLVPPLAINENGVGVLLVALNDAGTLDSHSVDINWGDGSAVQTISVPVGQSFVTAFHQYFDDNPTGTSADHYTIGVRVLDDDGGASPLTQTSIKVSNVAPSGVQIAPIATVNENDLATLNLTFDDPGALDSHQVEINWGDGSAVEVLPVAAGARTFTATHRYLDDNPTGTSFDNYNVRARVWDDDGGVSATASTTARVNNVAPSVILAPPLAIDENGVGVLLAAFNDPGTQDSHRVEINWGDGSAVETISLSAGQTFLTAIHQYLDDNPTGTPADNYTIGVRVLDDDGGASTLTQTTIKVSNVAPSNVQVAPLATINENDLATLDLTFDDPGVQDAHQVEVNWGDGSAVQVLSVAAGARALSATHQFLDDNPSGTPSDSYTVAVRVLDDDGGASPPTTAVITVNNVAPLNVAVIPPAKMVDEGSPITLDFTFDDPGAQDAHTYQIDWGDGLFTSGAAAGHAFSAGHTYADNGNYTVRVTVTDDDGGVGMGMGSVSVNNVAPTLNVIANQTINEGSLLELENIGTISDPGFNNPLNTQDPGNDGQVAETFTFDVDWGDGTAPTIGFATIDSAGSVGMPTLASFNGVHTYADNGVYTVTVTVLDDDFGQAQKTFTVTVLNVDPTLKGDAPAPTVKEGQSFTLASLGVKIQDPGFDNPLNAGNAGNGGETEETLTAITVDWGDGTTLTPLGVANRLSGSATAFTTADFVHDPHTYADNGTYTVTILLQDDDGPVVARTLSIVVENVPPSLTLTDHQFVIKEGETLTIPELGKFTDPGFDNSLNGGNAANGGETHELFTYTIDWGDGTVETKKAPATRVSGSPGVLTMGTLADFHFYADNDRDVVVDNKYTITVTLADDDGDEAVKTFDVTVLNVNPKLEPVSATDVNTLGNTTVVGQFSDQGADSFEVWVDWGDKSGKPEDDYFVKAADIGILDAKTFVLSHHYKGPPDPQNPAADITIRVKVRDDDFKTMGIVEPGESLVKFDVITNPGEGNKFIRIDLSPKVPMLSFTVRPVSTVVTAGAKTALVASDSGEIGGAAGESLVSSERDFVLRIVDNRGNDIKPGYKLPPDVLEDLPALFRRLPDNTYRIYLVQGETQVERLVIEVVVRNGRMIDPGDDSEGARDKPPTDESAPAAAPAAGAALEAPTEAQIDAALDAPGDDAAAVGLLPTPGPATAAAWRHGSTLASVALALSAAGKSWRAQVDETLAKAQSEKRRQLRTAGHWRRKKPR